MSITEQLSSQNGNTYLLRHGDDYVLVIDVRGVVSLGRDVIALRVTDAQLMVWSPYAPGLAVLDRDTSVSGSAEGRDWTTFLLEEVARLANV